MNDLISQVTPLTRGILWFSSEGFNAKADNYKAIDYLLDGLLTASLSASRELSSKVILGKNFNHPFYVFFVKKVVPSELESFLNLVKPSLAEDNYLLVIDENDSYSSVEKKVPKDLQKKLRFLK